MKRYQILCTSCIRTLAKQGEHLEQDSRSTRRRLKSSQPEGLQKIESAKIDHKFAITDYADRSNCIIDWDGAKATDRESNINTIWTKIKIRFFFEFTLIF